MWRHGKEELTLIKNVLDSVLWRAIIFATTGHGITTQKIVNGSTPTPSFLGSYTMPKPRFLGNGIACLVAVAVGKYRTFLLE